MASYTHFLNEWYQLLQLSKSMLQLALEGEWEALITGEMKYVAQIEKLSANPGAPTSKEYQSLLSGILNEIISNENEVKSLLQVRMNELKILINQESQKHSLIQTYSQHKGDILIPEARK